MSSKTELKSNGSCWGHQPPRVTVITPVYNSGGTIERALQSVSRQSYMREGGRLDVSIHDDRSEQVDTVSKCLQACKDQLDRVGVRWQLSFWKRSCPVCTPAAPPAGEGKAMGDQHSTEGRSWCGLRSDGHCPRGSSTSVLWHDGRERESCVAEPSQRTPLDTPRPQDSESSPSRMLNTNKVTRVLDSHRRKSRRVVVESKQDRASTQQADGRESPCRCLHCCVRDTPHNLKGAGSARNIAVMLSSQAACGRPSLASDLLCFLDSDDACMPERISWQVACWLMWGASGAGAVCRCNDCRALMHAARVPYPSSGPQHSFSSATVPAKYYVGLLRYRPPESNPFFRAAGPGELLVGTGVTRGELDSGNYERWINAMTPSTVYTALLKECTAILPSWLLRRGYFEECGGFGMHPTGFPEDMCFLFRHVRTGGLLYTLTAGAVRDGTAITTPGSTIEAVSDTSVSTVVSTNAVVSVTNSPLRRPSGAISECVAAPCEKLTDASAGSESMQPLGQTSPTVTTAPSASLHPTGRQAGPLVRYFDSGESSLSRKVHRLSLLFCKTLAFEELFLGHRRGDATQLAFECKRSDGHFVSKRFEKESESTAISEKMRVETVGVKRDQSCPPPALDTVKKDGDTMERGGGVVDSRFWHAVDGYPIDYASASTLGKWIEFHRENKGQLHGIPAPVPLVQSAYNFHAPSSMRCCAGHGERLMRAWPRFGIWGLGRDGRQFFSKLSPAAKDKVDCFYDIDPRKLERKKYTYHAAVRLIIPKEASELQEGDRNAILLRRQEQKSNTKPKDTVLHTSEPRQLQHDAGKLQHTEITRQTGSTQQTPDVSVSVTHRKKRKARQKRPKLKTPMWTIPVRHVSEIRAPFVVAVATWTHNQDYNFGARPECDVGEGAGHAQKRFASIHEELANRGWREGIDFVFIA